MYTLFGLPIPTGWRIILFFFVLRKSSHGQPYIQLTSFKLVGWRLHMKGGDFLSEEFANNPFDVRPPPLLYGACIFILYYYYYQIIIVVVVSLPLPPPFLFSYTRALIQYNTISYQTPVRRFPPFAISKIYQRTQGRTYILSMGVV